MACPTVLSQVRAGASIKAGREDKFANWEGNAKSRQIDEVIGIERVKLGPGAHSVFLTSEGCTNSISKMLGGVDE
jgi:hypothetical protein